MSITIMIQIIISIILAKCDLHITTITRLNYVTIFIFIDKLYTNFTSAFDF